jgi:PAS domain S-box-containing protein
LYGQDEVTLIRDLASRTASALEAARLHGEAEERADAARVLSYVSDGVFLVDQHGVVRFWNLAAEAITGIASMSVVGRRAAEAIPEWERVAERIPVTASVDSPTRPEMIPFEADGSERWLSISGVEFFGGVVYAFHDSTETRRLDQLKSDFVATASHELRTPLAAVYGAAQTLRRHDFALDEGGRERFVSLIVDESERLSRIVNEILLASQLDAGTVTVRGGVVDPVEVAERVVDAAKTYAPSTITVVLDAPAHVPSVLADREKLRQVLVNLVQNAIKYSPNGGTITVGAEPDDGRVRVFVKDEGLGIPADEQERIFEKFYRLDPDLSSGVGGTGLGLYICRELVEQMGGEISVTSGPERGSIFFVALPAADAGTASMTPNETASALDSLS